MRLHWFSPLPPQRTDIAHFTKRLALELIGCFDITFWTDLDFDPAELPPGAEIRMFGHNRLSERDLRVATADGVNLYNLGNDARFHAQIADLASNIPGITIFHDIRLHHLVYERSRHDPMPFARYLRDTSQQYGALAGIRAEEIVAAQGATIDNFVERAPFTKLFADSALAAVCHSKWAQAQLQALSVPTIFLELPFDAPSPAVAPARRVWRPPWQLVMYGYMGSNRRVESVLEALSQPRFRSEFRLDLYGSLANEELIRNTVRQRGLDSCVTIHGFVHENELNSALESAHLTFHLRHPTMGETSGGILRSWALAAPTLVTAAGWFDALPSEVTFKIPIEDEVNQIRSIMEELSTNPLSFRLKGEAGLRYLTVNHRPRTYAEGLRTSLSKLPEWKTREIKKMALTSQAEAFDDYPANVQKTLAHQTKLLIDSLWRPS